MNEPKTPSQPEGPERAQATSSPEGNGADGNVDATMVLEDLQQLRTRAQERDQFLELLKRTQADFENFQKRVKRDQDQERRYWNSDLARGLLPVLDNLDRAMGAAKQAGESGPLVQGVGMVQNQLLDLFRRHGITRIEAEGKPFDPHLHQAVMQKPSAEVPPNTVLQVLEQGFMIHDRVLRPASVVVSVQAG
jgi:molecular chaperone GrpE